MKRRVENRKSYLWFGPLALLTVSSCGEYVGTLESASIDKQETTTTQTFTADLTALNADLFQSEGEARVVAGEETFQVEIEMRNVSEGTHRQTLISGGCPTSSADTNGDGIIDGEEYSDGESAVWDLDDSLADTTGESVYPVGDSSGQYQYSASLPQMEEAVMAPDVSSGEYSIVVFGVDDETELPETVSGERSDIPVACGTLQREAQDDEPQGDEGQMPDMDQDQGQQDQIQHTQQQHQQQQHQQMQQTQQGQGQQNVMIPEENDSDLEMTIME